MLRERFISHGGLLVFLSSLVSPGFLVEVGVTVTVRGRGILEGGLRSELLLLLL